VILVENLSVPFDRRAWQEARTLTEAGYEVEVICPQGRTYDIASFEVLEGVRIHRYPLRPAERSLVGYVREYAIALWWTTKLLRKIASQAPVTFVHACNPPDFLLVAALLLRRGGTACIFDHHDLVPELYESRFGRAGGVAHAAARILEKLAFRLADVVISTNESYRQVAMERGGIAAQDVIVVRSGPDLSRFHRVEPDPQLRGNAAHVLAYVGVMGPQDGVDHALRALACLLKRRDDWRALFVGAGDVFEDMQALSRELGLAGHVEFLGRVPNEALLTVLSTADLALAPDPISPLNDLSTMNKIMEYMAVGVPIVSYDLRESRVSAADAATYVRSGDVSGMAAAIDELLSDAEQRDRMSVIGRARVAGELSWETSTANLLRAYQRAAEKARERAHDSPATSVGPGLV
jgi:glycosyltransferase involved in cell wall biosynthesis